MYYILLLFGLYEILKCNMKFHKYSQCFVEGRDVYICVFFYFVAQIIIILAIIIIPVLLLAHYYE